MFKLSITLIKLLLLFSFIFSFFPLISFGGQELELKGKDKIVVPQFLKKFDSPERKLGIIVLLSGYRSYVGVVNANDTKAMASIQAEIRTQQNSILKKLNPDNVKLRHQFSNILGFSAVVTLDGLKSLAQMDEVEVIEEDEEVFPSLAQGIPLINATNPRTLYDGTGLSVAIVDTGIDYSHSMLGGGAIPNSKVIGGFDFGDNDPDPMDCEGHGTAVAGIVAGTQAAGPGDYIGGVAPNAKLYGLKILPGCTGSASISSIVAAWDWAVVHKNDDPANPIMIINTSFAGIKFDSVCDGVNPTLAAAATVAVANGITLFVSSGNDGYCDGMGRPACVSDAISVGAVYDADIGQDPPPGFVGCISNDSCVGFTTSCACPEKCYVDDPAVGDQVATYSNSASFLDILASSNNAYTTGLFGAYNETFGGTSAASPYAAGAATVLQHAAKTLTGSFLSPADVKSRLINTGVPIEDSKSSITKPRIDLEAAISGSSSQQTPDFMIKKGLLFDKTTKPDKDRLKILLKEVAELSSAIDDLSNKSVRLTIKSNGTTYYDSGSIPGNNFDKKGKKLVYKKGKTKYTLYPKKDKVRIKDKKFNFINEIPTSPNPIEFKFEITGYSCEITDDWDVKAKSNSTKVKVKNLSK